MENLCRSPASESTVLFFGDSHTAGIGDPACLGWVGRLLTESWAAGWKLTGYNLGVRGQTSVEICERFESETAARCRARIRLGIVLGFGVNDTTFLDGAPTVDPATSIAALKRCIDSAERYRARIMVVGPAPVGDLAQTERIQALSRGFASICEKYQIPYVALAKQLRESELWREEISRNDGAHPGADGYQLLAALILEAGWIEWLDTLNG